MLFYRSKSHEDINNTTKSSLKHNPVDSRKAQSRRRALLCPWLTDTGSATVEAALAVPIFLFFIANLLALFLMFEEYCSNLGSLRSEAYEMSVACHMAGGSDMVTLTKNQSIEPIIASIGYKGASVRVRACARKWTGYDVLSGADIGDDEEYVYITEAGSVYHRSRECSHLKVTILITTADRLKSERNDSGERYKPCEKCVHGSSTGMLFITRQGNRYHNSASCSGLKRTVKTVPLSEVEGWPACSSCGG